MPALTSRLRKTLTAGALLTAALAGTAVTATPANAAGWARISSNSGGAWMRTCPNTGCSGITYLGNGKDVMVFCWTDAQWATGNYSSNRWFYVNPSYDNRNGYVHSSLIANQPSVPRC